MMPSAAVHRVRILGKPLPYGFTCHKWFLGNVLWEEGSAQYVHAKNNDGDAPLHCACEKGHDSIAAMLRAKGAVE